MVIIVNGSSTDDFKAELGLRKGYPLSPLLFVIVMEGLTTLMERAVELGDYKGFQFGENHSVDILHFTNDTITFGEEGNQNLWTLKAILRGFEPMSGLRVNFCKSNIYGINFSDRELQLSSTFLACGVGDFPFKF